ncbi:MAG: hypothetical protein KGV43_01170 [Arcobacter sp.]|nr:hypothetical protein [Arcobacter sp.]
MDLRELKKIREDKFRSYKRKKREYYLKNKVKKRKVVDYDDEFSGDFNKKIKEIAKAQKLHVDNRRQIIVKKINDYRDRKREYYEENKNKRLEYDREYREKKKEELKQYRREYYRKNREKILAKQREKRKTNKENENV